MPVYIDDMIVKLKSKENHIDDFIATFQTLTHFRLKLNPTKCMFGVISGMFLGFIVSQMRIEDDPEKIGNS